MTADPVQLECRDGVLVVRLHRPAVHNAVDGAMLEGLEALVDRLEDDEDALAVVLTGAGRSFCAGADLSHLGSLAAHDDGLELSHRMRHVLGRLADGPRPVIAAVNGAALGGGCEILTACHLRIAADSARFSFRQAAMGVVTGWGGGARLFRLLGRSRALLLLLTAATVDADEALRLGLVDRVVPADRVLAEALALAGAITANSVDSVRAFLELARAWDRETPAAAAALETRLFERSWGGEHFRRKVREWRRRGDG
ncbi:MAG: enoyl-CoA hydratase/isomerase family protein [Thermoanaerobaculia bacterium]